MAPSPAELLRQAAQLWKRSSRFHSNDHPPEWCDQTVTDRELDVSSAGIDRVLGNTWVGNAHSFFVQDDWKVGRRLTLNFGLRYDYQQKPVERNDGHINFDHSQVEPITGLPGIVVYANKDGQSRSFLNADKNDFAPRFGFAWDVFGTAKSALRGGYGVFYPSIFFRNFFGDTTLFSATRTNYVAAGPGLASFQFANGFPFAPISSAGSAAGPSALLGQSVNLFESDPKTPMTQQWNMSVQQQFREWLVDLTYAGNKGNAFVSSGYNLNQVDPAVRKQLGQSLFDQVTNPLAGKVPGGLGAARVTRERTLMRVLPDVRNPGTVNWDLSAIKNTALTEKVTLQFRAKAFNFLNHVNYGRPNGGFSAGPDGRNQSATFGVITSARDARVMQFGLKVLFWPCPTTRRSAGILLARGAL